MGKKFLHKCKNVNTVGFGSHSISCKPKIERVQTETPNFKN